MEANILDYSNEFGLVESFPFGKHYSSIKDKIANYILLKTLLFKIKSGISHLRKDFAQIQFLPIGEVQAEYETVKTQLEPIRKIKSVLENIKADSSEKELITSSLQLANLMIDYIEALEKTYEADLEVLEKIKTSATGKFYSYDEVFN
jgi:kynureninase